MALRGPALAVLAACTLALTAAPATADDLSGTIDIPCAAATLRQSADWYRPSGSPRGLIWLQHGFARSNANMADLARTYADAGYLVFSPSLPFMDLSGCTLQNLGDNTAFLNNLAALFSGDPAGALSASLTAALGAALDAAALPQQFVFIGHSAGAEAVEYVAARLHQKYPQAWAGLRGLILLDPVMSFLGDNTYRALTDLDATGLPILTVSGPPSLCNSFGSGTVALQRTLHRPFVGVQFDTGTHTDAEGASSDMLGDILCGAPHPANVKALRTLTLGWLADFFAGTTTPDYYPTGDTRTAATPAASGSIPAVPDARVLPGS
ncbi:alpha/beta hydrolase [Nocardia transvalensis]|uniref:alpha/beta hydrolase n=1 Tax=Nocardia transvalensis TaxID=37333 RepID=UPI001893D2AF|nr:alpha/beta hydrolase [Nocardia transvalensis]MBF6331151.1 alpha/beta hydrolase [Nocardia transvalensis]